ncbi:MAG: DUF58 domain-containing protein [Weeksellaceae bacterium]|jgi:uncharacterized protein (DUF58 family)|nr:DUF58 domain-containing protein [Weeksellaceae bacterium]MDX9704560.1 DUF58 domain-containing protein [Weeksellaceae bacterium]
MNSWFKLFLTKRFFYALTFVAGVYVTGFFWPVFLQIASYLLFSVIVLFIADGVIMNTVKKGVVGERETQDKFSNFDKNKVKIHLKNRFPFQINYQVLDEIPEQFQLFDFEINGKLETQKEIDLEYELQPRERGIYQFGKTNVLVSSPLGFLQRKIVLDTDCQIKVYPSFLRLRQFSLQNFKAYTNEIGQKKVRRLGHSMEFEQIKKYVSGDDIRTINWKATAKTKEFMVNQYTDEKSQQVYCVIDKGRVMKMPFHQLSLLDYAINSSLIISNVVLQNQDRVGVFTFSNRIENLIKAERRTNQMHKIMESLYSVRTDFQESDMGRLYNSIKYKITQRSLFLLFTNFESMDSMRRQLPYLQGINKNHLLVVVFFTNSELEDFVSNSSLGTDIYEKTLAEKFIYEKQQIVLELTKYGIQTVLTRPEDLTVNTLNKYLEIKSRGMI